MNSNGESSMVESTQHVLLAEMQVRFPLDGRTVSTPAKVFQHLWPSPRIVFVVSDVPRAPQPTEQRTLGHPSRTISTYPLTTEGPSTLRLNSGIEVSVVPSSWLYGQKDAEIVLQESPCVVLDAGEPIRPTWSLAFLNVTRDIFHWPLTLLAHPWSVTINSVPNLTELQRTLEASMGYAVTNNGLLRRVDGEEFSTDEAQSLLRVLDRFLSFVCGSECATTNATGYDISGNEAWKRWGAYHVSPYSRNRSWADITVRENLSDLFEQVWQTYSIHSKHLEGILGWYMHSNENRRS